MRGVLSASKAETTGNAKPCSPFGCSPLVRCASRPWGALYDPVLTTLLVRDAAGGITGNGEKNGPGIGQEPGFYTSSGPRIFHSPILRIFHWPFARGSAFLRALPKRTRYESPDQTIPHRHTCCSLRFGDTNRLWIRHRSFRDGTGHCDRLDPGRGWIATNELRIGSRSDEPSGL